MAKKQNKKFVTGYPKPKPMDDIHYNFRRIDSTNKQWRLIVSAREAGKTTAMVIKKIWAKFREGGTTLLVRRQVADITEAYIMSLQFILNKFVDDDIELTFNKAELRTGFVLVYCNGDLIMGILGLSTKAARLKSLVLPRIKQLAFDEYIINPKWGEKYLVNEADKLKEVYKTFNREYLDNGEKGVMPCYIMGNPYSRFNPLVEDWGVDYNKLYPGSFVVGDNYVIENYLLSDELVEQLKQTNPDLQKDVGYTDYALKGIAINDRNIPLGKIKNGMVLKYVVQFDTAQVGIYKDLNANFNSNARYYAGKIKYDNLNRNVYCFNFNDLSNGSILYSRTDNNEFMNIAVAMRRNQIIYDDIGTYYKLVDMYSYL